MQELRELCERLGFGHVRSLLNSGNLVFRSDVHDGARIERVLAAEAKERLGLRAGFFVRSAEEWRKVVAGNPFPEEARRDPSHLLLMLLTSAPKSEQVEALRAAITGPELVRARGRGAYFYYPSGIGRSRLTNTLIEKTLGTSGTGRNWNTVLKLHALTRA